MDLPRAVVVSDPDDPRLAHYRDLKERLLAADSGRFIAESERVVRRLLESPLEVESVFGTEARLAALGDALARRDGPIFVASQAVLDRVAGFHVHRGCLAVGRRPAGGALAMPPDARTILVLEDLVDVDNLGASVRNATAFAADALVLSPRCADPYYRKAIRVAMGTTFALPIVRCANWPDDLLALKRAHGFAVWGAVLDAHATPLSSFSRPPRVAILLGAEGPGLSPAARAACDGLFTIPMAPAADSLNVATAGAIALYHVQQATGPT